jgi:molybdenum cofactor cytidylyltransferase
VTIGILLLAAGRSRRFGSDKRLACLPGGRPLLQQTLLTLRAAKLPLRVCLRPGDAVVDDCFEPGERLVCPGADGGMGRSLAEGVAQLPGHWQGLLVALADMPWVQPQTLRHLVAALEPGGIVVPLHAGQRGHPVAFHRHWFPMLQQLQGDRGARALIDAAGDACRRLPVDDPGVLRDVDRPADLTAGLSPAGADPG